MFWGFKRFFDFQRVTVKFPVSFIKLIDPTSFHILLRRINLENVIKPDKREHKCLKKKQKKKNTAKDKWQRKTSPLHRRWYFCILEGYFILHVHNRRYIAISHAGYFPVLGLRLVIIFIIIAVIVWRAGVGKCFFFFPFPFSFCAV